LVSRVHIIRNINIVLEIVKVVKDLYIEEIVVVRSELGDMAVGLVGCIVW